MTLRFLLLLSFIITISCNRTSLKEKQNAPLTSFVNPFIGTGGHGHTYPGATLPFGMMQLSPDTRLEGWDGCSGYHYSDSIVYGFSHTHLSGTGVSDYGDVLLMPTDTVIFNNGSNGKAGYRSSFSHEKEIATPGFYSVELENTDIKVSLTVSKRSGMHKYEYPSAENQYLILDLEHRDQLLESNVKSISNKEISGYRYSNSWAKEQRLYFYISFSHPIENTTYFHRDPDRKTRMASYQFINPNNEPVYISVGISAVSEAGAKENALAELTNKSFNDLKQEAQSIWEKQLQKIQVSTKNKDNKIIFYTALYHSMLAPNLYSDINGDYRGMDLKVHNAKDYDYYTVFSLWDTYRATHPLYTLIEEKRTNDFIKTMTAKYQEGGILPIWDLAANYTGCMIGYHAVPVIADAYLKGIDNYNVDLAFEAMKHSAIQDKLGLESYKKQGFIPMETESESVSKNLEYAYDDWTIAQMAKALGKQEDYIYFLKRAQHYKNSFDPSTHFMRGRFQNTWFAPFDPYEVNFNYTEANAWQYSLYTPQDINGLIHLMGGKENFSTHLDNVFSAKAETSGRNQADITGLIGQYAHGNEPSHHMAYLYNFVNQPSKTQEKVHEICTTLYSNTPDGISGNEDCGQMSAWYIFSSLGFYPVTPANNQYIIGTPLFEEAKIVFEDSKQLLIKTKNYAPENIYIASVTVNGKNWPYSYFTHNTLRDGGEIIFTMSPTPTTWATKDSDIPTTIIDEHLITPTPFIKSGAIAFKDSTSITLGSALKTSEIYYSLNNEPFKKYLSAFTVTQNTLLKTYALNNEIQSTTATTQLTKIDPNLSITLNTTYENQYNGGGQNALIDGLKGGLDFRTGAWQGYQDTDLDVLIDLGKETNINTIKMQFLQDQRSWIFYPSEVVVFYGTEKNNISKSIPKKLINSRTPSEETLIMPIQFNTDIKARYIKIKAKNIGALPEWHLGASHQGKAWLFVDEISIN